MRLADYLRLAAKDQPPCAAEIEVTQASVSRTVCRPVGRPVCHPVSGGRLSKPRALAPIATATAGIATRDDLYHDGSDASKAA
jgi:hypothetical protein